MLMHAATVIIVMAFFCCLIDLTHCIRLSHHLIRLNRETKQDLNVWLSFFSKLQWPVIFSQGTLGRWNWFWRNFWHRILPWPDEWHYRNIAILEFYLIVLGVCLWGSKMVNHSVLFSLITKLWFMSSINSHARKDSDLETCSCMPTK